MNVHCDISIDDYHASDRVSASKLTTFAREGARSYYDHYIARTITRPQTRSMLLGQAFEDLIQRPNEWDSKYVKKPANMKFSTKDGKEWLAAQTLPFIDEGEYESLSRMAESMRANSVAMALAGPDAHTQATAIIPYDGLPGLQARPDWIGDGAAFNFETRYYADLKTTAQFQRLVSGRGIIEMRYHVQAAIARECLRDPRAWESYIIACESVYPYRCKVVELPREWLDAGWKNAERLLMRLARCYREGWPCKEQAMVTLGEVPRWAEDL